MGRAGGFLGLFLEDEELREQLDAVGMEVSPSSSLLEPATSTSTAPRGGREQQELFQGVQQRSGQLGPS